MHHVCQLTSKNSNLLLCFLFQYLLYKIIGNWENFRSFEKRMRRRNEGERGVQKKITKQVLLLYYKTKRLFLTIDHKYILWSFRIIISIHLEDSTHSVDTCQQHRTLLNSSECNYNRKWMLNNTQTWCIGHQISTELPFLLRTSKCLPYQVLT